MMISVFLTLNFEHLFAKWENRRTLLRHLVIIVTLCSDSLVNVFLFHSVMTASLCNTNLLYYHVEVSRLQ